MSRPKITPDVSDPYNTISYSLKLAQQALRNRLDNGLREIGLTTPQYGVLTFLKKEAGASNATLARHSFVTPQTMQGILVALEREGYITRTAHPDHGRIQKTELTTKGSDALIAASNIIADTEARLCEACANIDSQEVTTLLLRLANALR